MFLHTIVILVIYRGGKIIDHGVENAYNITRSGVNNISYFQLRSNFLNLDGDEISLILST